MCCYDGALSHNNNQRRFFEAVGLLRLFTVVLFGCAGGCTLQARRWFMLFLLVVFEEEEFVYGCF
jgi:hypothetical protein